MSDLYDLVQFGHMNPNDDVIQMLKQDFNQEIPNDIREYNWNEAEDKFWDGGKKETKIAEVMKNPKKNNRRINIPDAEIKHFHNRFYYEDEGYYEPSEREQDPIETPAKNRYNQPSTQYKRGSELTHQKVAKK